jgi:hypothetical protein
MIVSDLSREPVALATLAAGWDFSFELVLAVSMADNGLLITAL